MQRIEYLDSIVDAMTASSTLMDAADMVLLRETLLEESRLQYE